MSLVKNINGLIEFKFFFLCWESKREEFRRNFMLFLSTKAQQDMLKFNHVGFEKYRIQERPYKFYYKKTIINTILSLKLKILHLVTSGRKKNYCSIETISKPLKMPLTTVLYSMVRSRLKVGENWGK